VVAVWQHCVTAVGHLRLVTCVETTEWVVACARRPAPPSIAGYIRNPAAFTHRTTSITEYRCRKTIRYAQWRRQRSKGARSFRGQKILQPGHPDALFPQKSWRPFVVVALKIGRQRRFTVTIKQIKRSDMVTFLFSIHAITEAKQCARLARAWARAVDLPARSFDLAHPSVASPLDTLC